MTPTSPGFIIPPTMGEEGSLHEIRAALGVVTRRLDDLAAGLARLVPGEAATPIGSVLDESTRARLGSLRSVLAIGPDLPRDQGLTLALDRVIHLAHADGVLVVARAPGGGTGWVTIADRGMASASAISPTRSALVDRALGEREVVRADGAETTRDPLLCEAGLRHAVAIPFGGERPVGVLLAGRRRDVPFDLDTLEVLTVVGDRLALLLTEGSGAGDAHPGEWFTDQIELPGVATAVAVEARRRLGASSVAVLAPDGEWLAVTGDVALPPDAGVELGSTPSADTALRSGRPCTVGDGPQDAPLSRWLGAPARLVVPLALAGRPVALLVAAGPASLEARALGEFEARAAVALGAARLLAERAGALAERAEGEPRPASAPRPVRDFASLLAIILARVGLVRERLADDPIARGDLSVVEEAAWRAAEAIREALGLVPCTPEPATTPFDAGAVIRAAVAEARTRWEAAALHLGEVRVEADALPPLRGSPAMLGEALAHLLDNAAEAAAGGGAVSVRARWDGARRVEIVVADTGAGMSEEVRVRAVEPFYSTKGPGRLGLGLALAQAIVTRQGGGLSLDSIADGGTRVRLELPTVSSRERRPG